jgi:putative lipoprotein (rSAM/lipoprotein system)
MYGVFPAEYDVKSAVDPENWADTTDVKGEFRISDQNINSYFYPDLVPMAVSDIDGEKNGSFESDTLYIDLKDAVQTGKPKAWYGGELTKTVKVELTEKKSDE